MRFLLGNDCFPDISRRQVLTALGRRTEWDWRAALKQEQTFGGSRCRHRTPEWILTISVPCSGTRMPTCTGHRKRLTAVFRSGIPIRHEA